MDNKSKKSKYSYTMTAVVLPDTILTREVSNGVSRIKVNI